MRWCFWASWARNLVFHGVWGAAGLETPAEKTPAAADAEEAAGEMDAAAAEEAEREEGAKLEKPSLGKPGLSLFMQAPPALREATVANLEKPLSELLDDGDVITVTDPVFPKMMPPVEVKVFFCSAGHTVSFDISPQGGVTRA